jgi:carboxypeptidase Q
MRMSSSQPGGSLSIPTSSEARPAFAPSGRFWRAAAAAGTGLVLLATLPVAATAATAVAAAAQEPAASAAAPASPAAETPPLAAMQPLPDDVVEGATALRDAALKGTKAQSIVESLTTEVGPRSAGSPGDSLAVAWALRTLKELGFSNVHAEKVTVPHWDRGAESGEIVAPYRQRVALAALGGSVGTSPAGLEATVVEVANLEELGKLSAAQVTGRIVFFNTPTERRRDEDGYGKAVRVRASGPSQAAKLGAVAVVLRSIGTDSNRLPHTGATRYAEGVRRIPAAALSSPDADLLAAEIKSGKPVRFRLKLGCRTLPPAESANVIGEIPGSDSSPEIVLLGAHLDSWDLGTGAIDDGAGVAIVTETARRIGELKTKPHRTLRVVLFANEEFGLSGALAYAKAHAAELPHHVLALESDLGSGRVWRLESRIALEEIGRMRDFNQLVFPLGVTSGGNLGDGGADVGPLLGAGVPTLALMQDATNYFDFHHTANDTLDKVNARDLDYNVAAWTAIVYAVANMPGDLGRVKMDAK